MSAPNGEDRVLQGLQKAVFSLTTSVGRFKGMVDQLGTPKDTADFRVRLKKLDEQLVVSAREVSGKLSNVSSQLSSGRLSFSPNQKMTHAKLVRDLQTQLSNLKQSQRQRAEKEARFAPKVPAGQPRRQPALDPAEEGEDEERGLLAAEEQRRVQEFDAVENELEFNDALLEEREAGIEQIQRDVQDVHEVFKDLAILVNEQGGMLEDIESNIVAAEDHIQGGNQAIEKAQKYQKSARNKLCFGLVLALSLVGLLVLILLVTHSF